MYEAAFILRPPQKTHRIFTLSSFRVAQFINDDYWETSCAT